MVKAVKFHQEFIWYILALPFLAYSFHKHSWKYKTLFTSLAFNFQIAYSPVGIPRYLLTYYFKLNSKGFWSWKSLWRFCQKTCFL